MAAAVVILLLVSALFIFFYKRRRAGSALQVQGQQAMEMSTFAQFYNEDVDEEEEEMTGGCQEQQQQSSAIMVEERVDEMFDMPDSFANPFAGMSPRDMFWGCEMTSFGYPMPEEVGVAMAEELCELPPLPVDSSQVNYLRLSIYGNY